MSSIPKKLIIVEKIYKNYQGKKVIDIFPVDATNPKTLETALSWVKNGKENTYAQTPCDNVPIEDVVIKTLEHRGEGGRAYKILINNKYRYDLREDVLMDVILNEGIDAGGRLKGKFVFGIIGSQMKLILIGSKLYNDACVVDIKRKEKPIKNFKPGHIYESITNKEVFLGKGQLLRINQYMDKDGCHNEIEIKKNVTVWLDSFDKENFLQLNTSKYYNFRKSHSFIKETGDNLYKKELGDNFKLSDVRKCLFEKFLKLNLKDIEKENLFTLFTLFSMFLNIPFDADEEIVIPTEVLNKMKIIFPPEIKNIRYVGLSEILIYDKFEIFNQFIKKEI